MEYSRSRLSYTSPAVLHWSLRSGWFHSVESGPRESPLHGTYWTRPYILQVGGTSVVRPLWCTSVLPVSSMGDWVGVTRGAYSFPQRSCRVGGVVSTRQGWFEKGLTSKYSFSSSRQKNRVIQTSVNTLQPLIV